MNEMYKALYSDCNESQHFATSLAKPHTDNNFIIVKSIAYLPLGGQRCQHLKLGHCMKACVKESCRCCAAGDAKPLGAVEKAGQWAVLGAGDEGGGVKLSLDDGNASLDFSARLTSLWARGRLELTTTVDASARASHDFDVVQIALTAL